MSSVTSAATSAASGAVDYAGRVVALLDGAETLMARTGTLLDRVEAVTARAEETVAQVALTSAAADRQVRRVSVLLDQGEPMAAAAVPLARRFLESLTEREVAAMIQLIDRAPEVLDHVDETVVPTMQQMSDVGPDIKQLLAAVGAMRELVESLPGMGRVRKRIASDGD